MSTKPSHKPFIKCSLPDCNNRVGQHRKGRSKQFCEPHRKYRKHEVDLFKSKRGCQNDDGRYGGLPCSCSILDPSQLEINHINGHNDDRRDDNIEVLCANCHRLATKEGEHHLTGKSPIILVNPELFDGLIQIA
jgi:hypothetical protein